MNIEDEVLEQWSDGGLERRPPARRCVRRGHLFGVHASACSNVADGGDMLKHAHPTIARRLFGVRASACSGNEQEGNMLKHGHPTLTRPLMKHRTPNIELRTLNCGRVLSVRQINRCSAFNVDCSEFFHAVSLNRKAAEDCRTPRRYRAKSPRPLGAGFACPRGLGLRQSPAALWRSVSLEVSSQGNLEKVKAWSNHVKMTQLACHQPSTLNPQLFWSSQVVPLFVRVKASPPVP
jgi:hypothetical protein